ncbi:LysR family transcriptional regulator [bacterium]|nr:LysR family transcriptional regulator [candidate division CSSED10-310 bacterium]
MDPLLKKKITIEDLYLFELLSSIGSISGVAVRTGLTQPAITQKLNRLESQIGASLWIRRGRSIGEPTEMGTRFLHYARNVIRETASLFREIGITGNHNLVQIAASSIPSEYLLPRLLAIYHGLNSAHEIHMTLAGSKKVCEMVENGDSDVGFSGFLRPGFSGKSVPIADDRIVPVVSRQSAIAKSGNPVTFLELASQPFVTRELESGTRSVLEEVLDKHGFANLIVHRSQVVGSSHALIEAIKQGAGFSFVSSFSVSDLYIPEIVDFPEIRRFFYLLFRNDVAVKDSVKTFIQFSKQFFSVL